MDPALRLRPLPPLEAGRWAGCRGRSLGLAAAVVLAAAAAGPAFSQSFDTSEFFTPQLGDYWLYRLNGSQDVLLEIVSLETAGGVMTYTSRWTGGPLDQLQSRIRFDPDSGVEALWNFQPSIFIDGVGFVDQRQDFDPPILSAPPVVTIGDVVHTSGALTQTYSNSQVNVSFDGTYSASYRFAFLEPVTVPFGTFQAVRRQIEIEIAVEIPPGQTEEVRATSRDWLVPNLGAVLVEQTFPSRVDLYELVDTNREPVPEPTSSIQLLAAWAALAGMRRLRERKSREDGSGDGLASRA